MHDLRNNLFITLPSSFRESFLSKFQSLFLLLCLAPRDLYSHFLQKSASGVWTVLFFRYAPRRFVLLNHPDLMFIKIWSIFESVPFRCRCVQYKDSSYQSIICLFFSSPGILDARPRCQFIMLLFIIAPEGQTRPWFQLIMPLFLIAPEILDDRPWCQFIMLSF